MHPVIDNAEKLVSAAAELADTKIRLAKLKVVAKVSESLSGLVSIIMIIVFGGGAITILSFGLAFLVGQALGNTSYGFFIIAAAYALAGWLVYYKRRQWIQEPLRDLFIDKLTADENEEQW